MSNVPGGSDWIQGQDGKWYPPNVYTQPTGTPIPPNQNPPQPQNQGPIPGSPQPGGQPQPGFGGQPQQGYGGQPQPGFGGQPQQGFQPQMQGGFQPAGPLGQPVTPKKSKAGLVIAIVIVVILLIGGGIAGYLVLSSSSDDPTSAVNNFMSALFSKDTSAACQYATGVTTAKCNTFVKSVSSGGKFSGSLKAANYQVSGTEALVAVVGNVCGGVFAESSGKQCQTNSNPNQGLPSGSTSFSKAWADVNSNGSIFTVPCEKLNGKWLVYLQNTSSNSGNSGNSGSTTTSSGSSGNSGSTTTSTTTGNSGNSGTTTSTTTGNSGNSGTTTTSAGNSGSSGSSG